MNPTSINVANGQEVPEAQEDLEAKKLANRSAHPTSVLQGGQFDGIAPYMESVEILLQKELRSKSWFVDELLTYVASMGGKRMRPALVLLSAQAAGNLTDEHVTLAAVVEMIHIATLVHDDILDGAETRRHRQTVNRRWDNQSSVLLGDYLFTHAFYLASTLPTTFGCRIIGEATNKVCAGELQQVGNRGNLELTEAEYLDIIRGKTAELCACATHLGAHYAGASPKVTENLDSYGRELGMAFQIVDDLLDLTGDENETGKSLGTDLENQKLTLPLIHLRDEAGKDPARHAKVLRLLGGPATAASREELMSMMEESGSLEYARKRAVDLTQSSMQRLEGLPDSTAKETLLAFCDFVIARTH